MIRRDKKVKPYSVYFVNDTRLKRLYNMYLHQSLFDKVLDVLVYIAIIFTVMSLILEFTVDLHSTVLHVTHSVSIVVLFIFMVELLREYAKSRDNKHFFKKNGLDLILVTFLSFYFLFVTYFGFLRAGSQFMKVKGAVQEFKHLKVATKLIRR